MIVSKMKIPFPDGAFGVRVGEQMRRVFEQATEHGTVGYRRDRVVDEVTLTEMSLGELLYHALVERADA
jgi:hypothetical protein